MATETWIRTGAVHHLCLTVSDVGRARDFYTGLLGFEVALELGPKVLLSNGGAVLALGPAPERAVPGDRFDENRVGLDHLSLGVASPAELGEAARLLDARGVPRGEIQELGPLGLAVLAFRDPDNIQLELTAPLG